MVDLLPGEQLVPIYIINPVNCLHPPSPVSQGAAASLPGGRGSQPSNNSKILLLCMYVTLTVAPPWILKQCLGFSQPKGFPTRDSGQGGLIAPQDKFGFPIRPLSNIKYMVVLNKRGGGP